MKLTTNSLVNVILSDKFIADYTGIIDRQKEVIKGEAFNTIRIELDKVCNLKQNFIEINGCRKLVFSDKSCANLAHYKVPKEIRFNVLKTLPNRNDIIQLSNKKAFKYIKNDNFIEVMLFMWNEQMTLDCHYFYIDIDKELVFFEPVDIKNNNGIINEADFIEKYYGEFMICVTYLELTDVTYDICYSNTKRGHILKNNDLNNTLDYNVIQVNTNWNITKLHIGDTFEVTGHWRLQPHGTVGNKHYKYIFIDTYEKTGIIKRKAGKDINNS